MTDPTPSAAQAAARCHECGPAKGGNAMVGCYECIDYQHNDVLADRDRTIADLEARLNEKSLADYSLEIEDLSETIAKLSGEALGLRRRIHQLEKHNQLFERCESAWCHPDPTNNPATLYADSQQATIVELREALENATCDDPWKCRETKCSRCAALARAKEAE